MLSDSEKRKIYDRGGEEALKQQGGFSSDPFDSFSRSGGVMKEIRINKTDKKKKIILL